MKRKSNLIIFMLLICCVFFCFGCGNNNNNNTNPKNEQPSTQVTEYTFKSVALYINEFSYVDDMSYIEMQHFNVKYNGTQLAGFSGIYSGEYKYMFKKVQYESGPLVDYAHYERAPLTLESEDNNMTFKENQEYEMMLQYDISAYPIDTSVMAYGKNSYQTIKLKPSNNAQTFIVATIPQFDIILKAKIEFSIKQ